MTKTIIITGGSDGLGKVLARDLARNNNVVIISPFADELVAAATEIGCEFFVGDVSDYDTMAQIADSVAKKHCGIDVLINNAGLWLSGRLAENEPERIRRVIEVNLLGEIFSAKAVLPHLRPGGMIINISSEAGFNAHPELSVYCATKWGVTGFSRSLAQELRADGGIRVTNIAPSKINTKMLEKAGIMNDNKPALEPKEIARLVQFIVDSPQNVAISEVVIGVASGI